MSRVSNAALLHKGVNMKKPGEIRGLCAKLSMMMHCTDYDTLKYYEQDLFDMYGCKVQYDYFGSKRFSVNDHELPIPNTVGEYLKLVSVSILRNSHI